ncbi:MAG: tetratricopeptide repeat protein, partial [Myxococcota bacterium]
LLVDEALQLHVTDFGLARTAAPDDPTGTLTRQGAGTRRYMSLEQLTGAPPAPTMDVFAAGAVLYELVTGAPAFPSAQAWQDALRTGDYPIPARPDLPPRMRDAVAHALCDLAVRDPDAAAVLARWTADAPPPGPPRADTLAWLALACAHDPHDDAHLALCPACRAALRPDPTWHPDDDLPHHVPAERDAFVGRDDALARLDALAVRGLVTVHGPAGIGKTRLTVRYAHRTRGRRTGGAWFCDLAEARDLAGICRAVARAVGVVLQGDDPVEQLGDVLAALGPALVVLDNFEQVASLAAATVGRWAARAEQAAFVVTSRVVLGLPGEQVLRLEPLGTDTARALLLQRVAAADPTFRVEGDPALDRLVELLDGLPLALELCAARLRALTPARVLERMGDRFRLLAERGRGARHGTLRAALDWSWDLLRPWEQAALAQCSVFVGGFDLPAVEAVVDLSAHPDAPWPLDVLQALVDSSLVRAGGDRYELLVSVHAYAAERLGDDLPARLRHAAHFADRADAAEHTDRPLLADLDNLVAAAGVPDADLAARVTLGAVEALELRGPFSTSVVLVEAAMARSPSRRWPRACWPPAAGSRGLGQPHEAEAMLLEALAAFRASGDVWSESLALSSQGAVANERTQAERARAFYLQALALHEARGDRGRQGRTLGALAAIDAETERFAPARERYDRALALAREAGRRLDEGMILTGIAQLLSMTGQHAEARALYEEALVLTRQTGHRKHEARILSNLGHELHYLGDTGALAALEQAAGLHRRVGEKRSEAQVLGGLGPLLFLAGRPVEAERVLEQALALYGVLDNPRGQTYATANLGFVYAATGRRAQARELFARVLAAPWVAGHGRFAGIFHTRVAAFHLDGGELDEARASLDRGLPALVQLGDPVELALHHSLRAKVAAAAGDGPGAAAALAAAEAAADQLTADNAATSRKAIDEARAALAQLRTESPTATSSSAR